MKRTKFEVLVGLIGAALLFVACVSTEEPLSTEIPKVITPSEAGEVPVQEGAPIEAAVRELAHQLGIDTTNIQVISVNPAEWPDSCLGAARQGEMCLDVITPGYAGVLQVNAVQYEFRSDRSGDQIRLIPAAVTLAKQALAQALGVDSETIHMVSFEQVMWRDSCLGVELVNQACLEVLTPGYRVVLQAGSEQYEYHTDESGSNLIQAESTQAGGDDVLLVWSQADANGCQRALISMREVSFGACEGPLTIVPFSAGMDNSDLSYFSMKYAPFQAQTSAGEISFYGLGGETATPAVQRMIAEWASLTRQVAEAGRAGAAWGLALLWHREGGMAKFCDDLAVHVTGIALASSCQIEQSMVPVRIHLNASQLEALYTWLDTLTTFEIKQTDPGLDAVTIYMQFVGNGEREASAEVQQAILNFAAQMYTQATSGETTE